MCKEKITGRYLCDGGKREDFKNITSRVNRLKEKMDRVGHV